MADVEVKMVVVEGVRYREEHIPAPKSDAEAQPVEDGAEVQHKQRTPRKTAARKVSTSE